MQVSAVNFADRTTAPRGVLVIAAVLIWLSAGVLAALAWRHDADARHLVDAVRIAPPSREARPSSPASVAKRYAKDAEQAARQASFPLNSLLAAVEAAPRESVTLTKFQASAEARSALVEVSSTSLEGVISYASALNAATPSGAWSLGAAETSGPSTLVAASPLGGVHATLTWAGDQ